MSNLYFPNPFHLTGFIVPSGLLPSFLVPVFLPYPFWLADNDLQYPVWSKKTAYVQGGNSFYEFLEIDIDNKSKILPMSANAKDVDGQSSDSSGGHYTSYSYPGSRIFHFNIPSFEAKRYSGLYAFGKSDGTVLFGERQKLATKLAEMKDEFVESPFLYLELCQFSGLVDEELLASNRARAVLNELNHEIASQWIYSDGKVS